MLKKSLCLVLGFMCIGDACGSDSPLSYHSLSGGNDLSKVEDHNVRKEETALKQKSPNNINTQQNKKSRIEECKTNTNEDEPNIVIMNYKQENGNINNVKESNINEKEAINSDPNIQEEATSGSCSNESSFEGNIDEENLAGNSSNLNIQSNKGCEDVFSIYVLSSYIENLSLNDDLKNPENVLIIQKINKTLENYIDKEDVRDLYFLNGLLRMLNRFPEKLSKKVEKATSTILTDLGYTEEEIETKGKKALIYDYIAVMDSDSLGELNI